MPTHLRVHSELDNQPRILRVHGPKVSVGSSPTNDLILEQYCFDPQAFDLVRRPDGWYIKPIGERLCELDSVPLAVGSEVRWGSSQSLRVDPYVFRLTEDAEVPIANVRDSRTDAYQYVKRVHVELLKQLKYGSKPTTAPVNTDENVHIERSIELVVARLLGLPRDQMQLLAGECLRESILISFLSLENSSDEFWGARPWNALAVVLKEFEEKLKQLVLHYRQTFLVSDHVDAIQSNLAQLEAEFSNYWLMLLARYPKLSDESFLNYLALRYLKKLVKDIMYGLGPLEDLVRMPGITEIMINARDEIYIEIGNKMQLTGRQFISDEEALSTIQRIVALSGRGRELATLKPLVDARLPGGGRISAVHSTVAVRGPAMTIRMPARQPFTTERLIDAGMLTAQAAVFLVAGVLAKRSILFSGGTGSGKTTLLTSFAQHIPAHERIICVEDTHEINAVHPHFLPLECRNANTEGVGVINMQQLVRAAKRKRPNRLIVGEVRGSEALDMLEAMNMGHNGSMTTIHANSATNALQQIEFMVRGNELSTVAIRHQIASGINIVVQTTRLSNSSQKRMITEITEVVRYDAESQSIVLRPIFQTVQGKTPTERQLVPTGRIPTFVGQLIEEKLLDLSLFLSAAN